jgi:1-phosphatidylinositol-3-phosphate 5-kinase
MLDLLIILFILFILEIKLCVYAFHQAFCCQSCKEPTESHVRCYTRQHGSLTISVRRLQSQKLPGECDGRIWMWHRCLKCEPKVVMSDAAWGLSFGKFLELSFSNHSSANRVASCGHSLQRDCLRFYGYATLISFACSYCSLLQ